MGHKSTWVRRKELQAQQEKLRLKFKKLDEEETVFRIGRHKVMHKGPRQFWTYHGKKVGQCYGIARTAREVCEHWDAEDKRRLAEFRLQ